MRLHDVQVIINSSNMAARYQEIYQHQGQLNQSNVALQLAEKDELKKTQIAEAEKKSETKKANENARDLEKEDKKEENRYDKKHGKKAESVAPERPAGSDHIIDITA